MFLFFMFIFSVNIAGSSSGPTPRSSLDPSPVQSGPTPPVQSGPGRIVDLDGSPIRPDMDRVDHKPVSVRRSATIIPGGLEHFDQLFVRQIFQPAFDRRPRHVRVVDDLPDRWKDGKTFVIAVHSRRQADDQKPSRGKRVAFADPLRPSHRVPGITHLAPSPNNPSSTSSSESTRRWVRDRTAE
jgi:hypothetical protein